MVISQLFGIFLMAAGLMIVLSDRRAAKKLDKVQNWPVTQGLITLCEVNHGLSSVANNQSKIRYHYLIDGREFVGKRISVGGDINGNRSVAEQRAQLYPEGTPVTIYYNPQNPKESYLELSSEDKHLTGLIGMSSMIIGAAFAVSIWPPL